MAIARRIVLTGKGGGAPKPTDPAWCYWDAIGTVDMREQGGYYDSRQGTGALFVGDTPQGWGGSYFDRV